MRGDSSGSGMERVEHGRMRGRLALLEHDNHRGLPRERHFALIWTVRICVKMLTEFTVGCRLDTTN